MSCATLYLLLSLATITANPDPAAVEAEAAKILAALPGDTAFAFTEIEPAGPKLLYGVRPDERMAVGSTFKLFIFGALTDEVNQGRRRADDCMLLQANLAGPPQSELSDWPIGSPVTLHTLALKMISISDNTATDHLLYLLGRKRVERQMKAMGHSDPVVNRPLLSTREMTTLRDKKRDLPGAKYRQLDEPARRRFLADLTEGVPDYDDFDFDTGAYQVAEWYASPMDMARALTWIQRHTEPAMPAHELLAILAVDPKLPHDAADWPYVGFKGGSEDQLLAGNWLLRNRNGRWYTMHLYYNNPHGKADPQQMVEAIGKIFKLVGDDLE